MKISTRNLIGLYAIVDSAVCGNRDPLEVARAIIKGGCAVVQLRAKELSGEALLSMARSLRALCRDAAVPFVVNDRPDIALTVDADGVHLGQQDMAIERARAILGDKWVGISTHTPAQAVSAISQGADLIGYGPIFSTKTKILADPTVGLEALAGICREASVPVVAIGGITIGNVHQVVAAGAPLVAAISALCGVDDPRVAARFMHSAILKR